MSDPNVFAGLIPYDKNMTESGTSNASGAPTILIQGLGGDKESGRQDSTNSPSGQSIPTRGSSSATPTRRRRISSHTSSWSLTIGLGNSNSDGGFDLDGESSEEVATGLFIRKDRFTASLESQFASEAGESGFRQELLIEPEPIALTSFEERVLQALQA